MTAVPLLRVQGLSKSFGGLRAVADVGFEVGAGDMVALIGPNGAGKTTCFNLLTGQLAADAGSARLDGQEMLGRSPQAIWRLGVGRSFQSPAVFGSMTALDNVRMVLLSARGRLFHGWWPATSFHRAESLAALAAVGLADHADRPGAELSYGDLKRLELAMALAHRPRLLLMDEPAAGLAPVERLALIALVRDLATRDRLAVLFTEHDMDVVFELAGQVVVFDRGRVIACGPPAAVRADPGVQASYLGTRPCS